MSKKDKEFQTCFRCAEETGKAGSEDSIYFNDIGPLCDRCFDELSQIDSSSRIDRMNTQTPKPPDGYESWLSFFADNPIDFATTSMSLQEEAKAHDNARAELAALRAVVKETRLFLSAPVTDGMGLPMSKICHTLRTLDAITGGKL